MIRAETIDRTPKSLLGTVRRYRVSSVVPADLTKV